MINIFFFNDTYWFFYRLTNDNKVLLSDYGYGELFSAEFYLAEDEKRKQIIKWFAQECLENGRFSSKSDVVCILWFDSIVS